VNPLSLLRRAPSDEASPTPPDELPIATGGQLAASNLLTRATTGGLLACLALGPVGALLALLAVTRAPTTIVTAPSGLAVAQADQAAAEELAQRVVISWLTSTRERPDSIAALVSDVPAVSLALDPFVVRDVATSRISGGDGGLWSVVVAASVTDANRRTVRRFYQVPVLTRAESVTALSLPAPVAAPALGAEPRSAYREQLATSSPISAALAEFLSAYLTGGGDVARYLTPGADLSAVTPPPFSDLRVDDVRSTTEVTDDAPADGQRVRALVEATAVVTDRQSLPVTYALSLVARAGRWEISGIDTLPAALTARSPSPSAGASSGGSDRATPTIPIP
jgi:hypothetical protein